MKKISIAIDENTFTVELYETPTAEAIYKSLPLTGNANIWGDEIYFEIPVSMELEDGGNVVEVGSLAYWPTGKAFCIFYGPTPMSSDERPVPASAVTLIGKILDDVAVLQGSESGIPIRIEKAASS